MPGFLKTSMASALAVHTMAMLAARTDLPVPTAEIAAKLCASEAHLSKVMQRLARSGLVRSKRGPKGGYILAKFPKEISLREIIEAVEGPMQPVNCLFDNPACDGEFCVLGDFLEKVNLQVLRHLRQTTLSDVAKL